MVAKRFGWKSRCANLRKITSINCGNFWLKPDNVSVTPPWWA
ncbi:Uncharacterised protein [Vibrio cholerae]|nr:Uncharacterised protein [Vibrio cholerae]